MLQDVTSRHLRGCTELLLNFDIKPGFVDISKQQLSYARRLRTLLRATFELRRSLVEKELGFAPGPLERLQTIFATQWAVIEGQNKLFVSVVFDRSWEEYVQTLVDEAGDSLDAFFCHCEGYRGFSCRDGHHAFGRWLRDHQVPCDLFYAAAPELTVDDLECFKKLAASEPNALAAALLKIGDAESQAYALDRDSIRRQVAASKGPHTIEQEIARQLERRTLQALTVLNDLRFMYPQDEDTVIPRAPEQWFNASEVFDRAVANIVPLIDKAAESLVAGNAGSAVHKWLQRLAALDKLDELPAQQAQANNGLANKDKTAGETKPLEIGEVQANILRPYPDGIDLGCVMLVSCDDTKSAREFIAHMKTAVTWEGTTEARDLGGCKTNLFITYSGLTRLGLPRDQLLRFPKEFREGLEQRAGLIGDVGRPNHPHYWNLPCLNEPPETAPGKHVPLASVDFVISLQRRSSGNEGWPSRWTADHPLRKAVLDLQRDGVRVLHVQPLVRTPSEDKSRRDHFGLSEDGGSQPAARGIDHPEQPAERDKVALGELLLGYDDNRGQTEWSRPQDMLFQNGSFLVMRKLAQHVREFTQFVAANGAALDVAPDDIRGWVVGRDVSGKALVHQRAGNDFDYGSDPKGAKCPFSAHIRLANPRVNIHGRPVPRIMRRGFSYGSPYDPESEQDGESERGLLFMAYNSSIARQFEVIQRWLNGANSTGVLSSHNDLLTAAPQPTSVLRWAPLDSIQSANFRLDVKAPFVSLQWGMYLFVPSKTALDVLRKLTPPVHEESGTLVQAGKRIINELKDIEAKVASREQPEGKTRKPKEPVESEALRADIAAWKQLIEEPSAVHAARRKAVWTAIRAMDPPTLSTPYGDLVAGREQAVKVLSDGGAEFSAHAYARPLNESIGNHYLGMDPRDPAPENPASGKAPYARLSESPNAYFGSITLPEAQATAYEAAVELMGRAEPLLGCDERSEIKIEVLATVAAAKWAQKWLGLVPRLDQEKLLAEPPPELEKYSERDRPLVFALGGFVLASKYSFFPHAVGALKKEASLAFGEKKALPVDPRRVNGLENDGTDRSLALGGGIVGFAAPAIASVLTVVDQLSESGELAHLANFPREGEKRFEPVANAVLRALLRTPIPPILYRGRVQSSGDKALDGCVVVVGLASACDDEPDEISYQNRRKWKWLFGGESGAPKQGEIQHHACPAREAALGFLCGVVCALLDMPNLKQERPFVFSFERVAENSARTFYERTAS